MVEYVGYWTMARSGAYQRRDQHVLVCVGNVSNDWAVLGRSRANGQVSMRLAKRHLFAYGKFGRVSL